MTTPDVRSRGQALLGALAAVAVSGLVGAGMVANYSAFIQQSRRAYIQSAMTNLDNKIRFMAMQPYAYKCGTGGDLTGIEGCAVNPDYFTHVKHVAMTGAPCASGITQNSCGFALEIAALRSATIDGQATKLFSYQLKYEGTDVSLRPLGYDPAQTTGMPIPTEILQAQRFDCALIDANKPVFTGFDPDGKPRCRGFEPCAPGEYVRGVNLKTLKLDCVAPTGTMLDCSGPNQSKIMSVAWNDGVINSAAGFACTALPAAPLNMPVVPLAGAGACPAGQVMSGGVCVTSTGKKWAVVSHPGGSPMANFLEAVGGLGPSWSQVQSAGVASIGLVSGPAECPTMGNTPPGTLLFPTNNLGLIAGGPCTTSGANCVYKMLLVRCIQCTWSTGWFQNTSETLTCQ